jgi:putative heme-binding domain-containing protein
LCDSREGGLMIVSLAMEKKFPPDLVDSISERIYRSPDMGVRALASRFFPRKSLAGTTLPSAQELSKMKGDASRGRAVFASKAAGCIKCHKFAGEGADIGPDLTTIRSKYARPQLLDAILNPSAAIAFGYEPWIVKTKKGQVYSGFVLSEGDTLTLKETSGEKRTIPSKDIALRKKQDFSVMPDNVAMGLTPQEIADVAEFLLTVPIPSQKN